MAAPRKILIIGDAVNRRDFLRGALEPVGYNVNQVQDVKEALGLLGQDQSDLLVLDIGGDKSSCALELAEGLLRMNVKLPLLAILPPGRSGGLVFSSAVFRDVALLETPFTIESVEDTVGKLLRELQTRSNSGTQRENGYALWKLCEPMPPHHRVRNLMCAILAGGKASRYGGMPKGNLRLPDGSTIIDRILGTVRHSGVRDVIIVANAEEPYRAYGCEIVRDKRPGLGPLGGIESALLHYGGRCGAVLILPCDLPGITADEILTLETAFTDLQAPLVFAETDEFFPQPLCAIMHNDLHETVGQALNAGIRSPLSLWRELRGVPVRFPDEKRFFNANTPQDMAEWIRREGAS